MLQLVRDWLFDPLALIFLFSLALAIILIRWSRGRRRQGMRRRRMRDGLVRRAFLLSWIAVFLFASAPAIVNPLIGMLESRHDNVTCEPGTPIVVLGGGIDASGLQADAVASMSPATLSRLAAAESLAIAEPEVDLILSGGVPPGVSDSRVAEADVMAAFLLSRGLPRPNRLIRDSASLNTAENAAAVKVLLPDRPRIRLVTSALHMPRAVATFAKQGLIACPIPTDRLAVPDVPLWALMPQTTALVKFDALLHEALALLFYRVKDHL